MSAKRIFSAPQVLLWIICLATLSVGARNFEAGLSTDAPLYAGIARNMVRTGEYFVMDSHVPDYPPPFAEHPHLGFWVLSVPFHMLKSFSPPPDWAARIPSHFFYVLFLCLFFWWVCQLSGEAVAVFAVFLLWTWPIFSNFFSNAYFDPGALFFGTAAIALLWRSLTRGSWWAAALSGFCLGLCALYKGLTVLGFGPPCAALVFCVEKPKFHLARRLLVGALALAAALLPLTLYVYALKHSAVPNFLQLYWERQITSRFAHTWAWSNIFAPSFWVPLLKNTHFLLPLSLLTVFNWRKRGMRAWLPALCFASFVCMYAPAERVGFQYCLMLMPALAWLIAEAIAPYILAVYPPLLRCTQVFAVAAMLVVQYGPMRTHLAPVPVESADLRALSPDGTRVLYGDFGRRDRNFLLSTPYMWYGDVHVKYVTSANEIPEANEHALFLKDDSAAPEREAELRQKEWCPWKKYPGSQIWRDCAELARTPW